MKFSFGKLLPKIPYAKYQACASFLFLLPSPSHFTQTNTNAPEQSRQMLITLLVAATFTRSAARVYPAEINLKAGVIPSPYFEDFQADLVGRLIDIALEDNVTLTVEKTTIQKLYTPNLALLSPDCHPGNTTEVNGVTHHCSDFDFIIGDFWTNPDRYKTVDFTPPWLTTSISTIKYTEKTKYPNLDVTTLTEATRAGVPVCALEGTYGETILREEFPDIKIVYCDIEDDEPDSCVTMLQNEDCFLLAGDELGLRYRRTQHPYFEMTGELRMRQLLAWPVRKTLDPTSSFLFNKWIYAAISKQVINDLYFEYYEKKLCPIGTAGVDCELPCDPDYGSSNAQGQCVCKSIRWTGDDCSIEVPQELNLIPAVIKGIAYGMFGLNAVLVLIGGMWLRVHWDSPAVKYSQPFFLLLVLFGCLVSTSTIIAMAQEDKGDGPVDACIAIPWLYSVGFSITFGTLFAKIYRVYGIFSQRHRSAGAIGVASTQRVIASFQETLMTIGKVLLLDVIILVLWTGVDPLHWERDVIRQDQFGFTLESQGTCTSDDWKLFLGALVALHIALCVVACYMCYVSRNIPSRYSEHKYLTIAMVSNLQVFAIGVPVLIIAEDNPAAHFFVRSAVVWMNDFVVLALIFGNLIHAVHISKSHGQITVKDKRKVSEALKSFEPKHDSLTSSRRYEHAAGIGSQNKAADLEGGIQSERENGSGNNGGTHNTSGSLHAAPVFIVSEISLSGFEGSSHHPEDKASAPSTPLSVTSKAESAARWVPSPSPVQERSEQMNSNGPALPTRVESAIDLPDNTNLIIPAVPLSNSSDGDDGNEILKAEQETPKQYSTAKDKQEHLDALPSGPERLLTSIAELEWSDDEENLTNQTPPALIESAPPERAPVMPVRFKSEILDWDGPPQSS